MKARWESLWASLIWRYSPREVKVRLAYTQQLATDLFVVNP
jgi:hypothetical protein